MDLFFPIYLESNAQKVVNLESWIAEKYGLITQGFQKLLGTTGYSFQIAIMGCLGKEI